MKVMRPVEVTTSKVLSTSAVNAYSDWSSSSTYDIGNKVTYNNYYWESLTNGNVNQNPETTLLQWVNIGPSNKWSMFDTQVSSQTESTGNLTFSIKPGQSINSLALFNVEGKSIHVQVLDAPLGNEIYSRTISLDTTFIQDYYSYFFDEFTYKQEAVLKDIPPYIECVVNVTLTGTRTKVGGTVFGTLIQIGETQQGLSYGIRDYSIKETDEFGVTSFVRRNYSKRMNPSVFVNNGRLNYIGKLLADLRAKPTAWVAVDDERFEGTIIYGYYKDWNIEVPYPNHSLISIEIEGLI